MSGTTGADMTREALLKQAIAVAEQARKKGGLIKQVASLIEDLANAELKEVNDV
jgi:hypothetical protein